MLSIKEHSPRFLPTLLLLAGVRAPISVAAQAAPGLRSLLEVAQSTSSARRSVCDEHHSSGLSFLRTTEFGLRARRSTSDSAYILRCLQDYSAKVGQQFHYTFLGLGARLR